MPHRTKLARHAAWIVCSVALVLSISPRLAAADDPIPAKAQLLIPESLKKHIPYMAGESMFILARKLGVSEVMGKPLELTRSGSKPSTSPPGDNVGIGTNPTKHENEPSVAANPTKSKRLVAGSHFFGPPEPSANRCVAYRSSDGGATWSSPVAMPQLTPQSECSDPVLAYAPNGSRVYYAYMDIKVTFESTPTEFTYTEDLDIVVSHSDNDGASWIGPRVALDADPITVSCDFNTGVCTNGAGFDYDKPWIATHVSDGQDGQSKSLVYVTATRFEVNFDQAKPDECRIVLARSADKSATWGAPTILDSSAGGCANPTVVQGSRPSGGPDGNVLAAWYHSGTDGFLNGSFQIRTSRSSDRGVTFAPPVIAATDSFELPFYLGPFGSLHRWWGGMFPDVELAADGSAHIAYTHDPVANMFGFSDTAEDGDIRYIRSAQAPYSSWSAPITLNDDGSGMAQGFVALETSGKGDSLVVHALWEDCRNSIRQLSNALYDMYYTSRGGGTTAPNRRLTTVSSASDYVFIGDYNDITTSETLVFGVWTDRRDKISIFDFEDDVLGTAISR